MTLEFIERFQVLAVGILGFAGVIGTLLTNAWLLRRQHRLETIHQATVLRAALEADLILIRDAYRERIKSIESAEGKKFGQRMLIPADAMTDVYSRLIDRIGVLRTSEVGAVMRAYVLVRHMPQRLALLEMQAPSDDEIPAGFVSVDRKLFSTLKNMHENFLTVIDASIAALRESTARSTFQ